MKHEAQQSVRSQDLSNHEDEAPLRSAGDQTRLDKVDLLSMVIALGPTLQSAWSLRNRAYLHFLDTGKLALLRIAWSWQGRSNMLKSSRSKKTAVCTSQAAKSTTNETNMRAQLDSALETMTMD